MMYEPEGHCNVRECANNEGRHRGVVYLCTNIRLDFTTFNSERLMRLDTI